jgi:hypothetical protein
MGELLISKSQKETNMSEATGQQQIKIYTANG